MVSFKEATDKIKYKRNAELATTEMSRRIASWDKLVMHVEDETYRTQPKVYKLLKQIINDIKESTKIHVYIEENIFL
jgi:hypothetical protein